MGIGYGDDIGKAIEIIERVITSDDRVLKDPAPTIAVSELADSSVNLVAPLGERGRLLADALGPDSRAEGRTRSGRLQHPVPADGRARHRHAGSLGGESAATKHDFPQRGNSLGDGPAVRVAAFRQPDAGARRTLGSRGGFT